MNAPRIAVSGLIRQIDGIDRSGVNVAYLAAVLAADGIPVILSPVLGPDRAEAALRGVEGLLLTGGEDVDPAHYGGVPSPRLGVLDSRRDAFELALFRSARSRGMPVLAVCRGLQLVNVALGGSLWQDLPTDRPGDIRHDQQAARDRRTHAVRVTRDTRTRALLGAERLLVNSFHHQAIRELGEGLVATGWAEDGVIEAAEVEDGGWVVGVQWHPESFHAESASPDLALFRGLVAESRRGTG
ncbi:MAG TPA: gamma-glutamyl-gamma-aminobutyrate hydrolase family protein [Gemmatimonadales bacterium]|nr:gamma-glutamyl-gamma-aminobutyrate hydrolase family protein [Gemmatimonadales bacterium]